MPFSRAVLVGLQTLGLLIGLSACDKVVDKAKGALSKVDKVETSQQHCTPVMPGTGQRRKVPDPVRQSFCTAVVLWCSYCEYSETGQLVSSGSYPCGVCMGMETK